MSASDQFSGHRYLNLETYRRSGAAVRTPVWFAEKDGQLYMYSLADAGKVKRIRNNPRVRVVPSDIRGTPLGEWTEGEARILHAGEAGVADRLLSDKYWMKRAFDWTSRFRRTGRAYLAVQLR
jgi:PPOX class probable F420-dependent enzyme